MTVGERIKKRRLEIGMSAEELGKLVGKSRATIYRYENDDIESKPIDIIQPMAEALRTSAEYLMGWTYNYIADPEGRLRSILPEIKKELEEKFPDDPKMQWEEYWKMCSDALFEFFEMKRKFPDLFADQRLSPKEEHERLIEIAKEILFENVVEVTDAMWEEVVNFAKYVEAREAAKRNENK